MLPPLPSPLQRSHPCLFPTYTRSVFEGRFELLSPSVRGTPSYRSYHITTIFLITFSFIFPNFLTNYSESAPSEKKLPENVFFSVPHKQGFVIITKTKKRVFDHFFF